MTPDIPTIQHRLMVDAAAIREALNKYGEAVTVLNATISALQAAGISEAHQALVNAMRREYAPPYRALDAALARHLEAIEVLRAACADAALEQQPSIGHPVQ
ncbi:MAG TPA: hypothetical protein VNL71_09325 [Chloroflexota bacterium]|nr:hypothetical protein [Chloroflexota bacterium]